MEQDGARKAGGGVLTRPRVAGLAVLLASALVLGIGVAHVRRLDSDLEITRLETFPGSGLYALRVRDRGDKPPVASAILLHGWRCNKSQLLPLAKHLARHGVAAYAVDLPGHGGATFLCPRGWPSDRALLPCPDHVLRSVEGLIKGQGLDRGRLALVGWSQGSAYLTTFMQQDPRYLTGVLIGPGHQSYDGVFPAHRIRRVLAITGSKESHLAAMSVVRMVTRQKEVRQGALYSAPGSGGAALWRIIPDTTHTGTITHPTVLSTVAGWIHFCVKGGKLVLSPARRPGPAPWLVGVLTLVLCLGVLVGGGLLMGPALPAMPACFSGLGLRELLLLLGAAGVGLIILAVNPLFTLPSVLVRTVTADRVVVLYWQLGVLGLTALLIWRRQRFQPGSLFHLPSVLIGLAGAALVLGLTAWLLLDPTLFHLSLNPPKLLRAALGALLIFPFFYLTEGALESLRLGSPGGRAAWVLARELLLRVALCGVLFLGFRLLGVYPYMMVALAAGIQVSAAVMNRATNNWLLSAAFNTTLLSWVLAASLVAWSWRG